MNDFLMGIAPTIASALLGPLGGVAVAGLGKILGLDSATTATVTKAISDGKLTPEQLTEIKKMELEYKDSEQQLGFKYSELEFKNTQGAREMQMAAPSWVPAALSVIIVIGYFSILLGMMYGVLHVSDNQYLLILIGALATAFGGVLNFWLGSSHGSQNKDQLLAQAQPK